MRALEAGAREYIPNLRARDLLAAIVTACSSFAHAGVMGAQALRNFVSRGELWRVLALVVIGIALIALAPAKQRVEREPTMVASKPALCK